MWLLLLLPLAFGASLDVNAGYVIESNLLIEANLTDTSWLGIYGYVNSNLEKKDYTYYISPLAAVINLNPPNEVRVADLNLYNSVEYPRSSIQWYAIVSPSGDVNLYELNDACDNNVDDLLEGNFTPDTLPSLTYDKNTFIVVNDRNLCALYAETSFGKRIYLLEWNGEPVYLSKISDFNLGGTVYNFAFLITVPPQLYLYLARENIICGDLVCDPGETNCSDCINLEINVSPDSKEANIGTSVTYTVTLTNNGNSDLLVSLSLREITAPGTYAASFSETNVTVPAGDVRAVSLVIGASDPGTYGFVVEGNVRGVSITSNEFVLVVVSPTPEETTEEGGGVVEENAPTSTEENLAPILTPRGYYIPWMGCISYINVFSPDVVEVGVDENVTVSVIVQNAGTCEENIIFSVEGYDSYFVDENSFSLSSKSAKTLDVVFTGEKQGVYEVKLKAKGFYTSTRKMILRVVGKQVIERGCISKLMFMTPDVMELVEGEEINAAAEVKNEGTCLEDVEIRLIKQSMGTEVLLDRRDIKIPPGERYIYRPPRLATGEYKLYLSSGPLKDEVSIVVRPRSVVTGVAEELLLRSRFAVLILMIVVLLAALSYLRSRYLSS